MELFEIKDDQVTFSPVALSLKPFRAIWDKDKTKGKKKAMAEMAAVYFFADYKSDFAEILDPTEKLDVIKTVIVGMPKDWEPSQHFDEAVEFYKERQQTITTVLVDDAKAAIAKISSFLRNVDLQETDEQGKFVYDVKKINDVIGGLPKTVETVNSLENTVKKEMQQADSMRGGHKKSIFEDGA